MRNMFVFAVGFALLNPFAQAQAWKDKLKNVQCVVRLAVDSADNQPDSAADIPMVKRENKEGYLSFNVHALRGNFVFAGEVLILPHQVTNSELSVEFAVTGLITQSMSGQIVDQINTQVVQLVEGVPLKAYSIDKKSLLICTLPVLK